VKLKNPTDTAVVVALISPRQIPGDSDVKFSAFGKHLAITQPHGLGSHSVIESGTRQIIHVDVGPSLAEEHTSAPFGITRKVVNEPADLKFKLMRFIPKVRISPERPVRYRVFRVHSVNQILGPVTEVSIAVKNCSCDPIGRQSLCGHHQSVESAEPTAEIESGVMESARR
jgi:hypothetical protein